MTTVLTLLLPLPYRALSPNARLHWREVRAAVRAYRTLVCCEVWRQLGNPPPRFAQARVTVFFVVGRPQVGVDGYLTSDGDNAGASFIGGTNGLVAAGLLAADDAEHLSLRCCVVRAQMTGGLVAVCVEGEAA